MISFQNTTYYRLVNALKIDESASRKRLRETDRIDSDLAKQKAEQAPPRRGTGVLCGDHSCAASCLQWRDLPLVLTGWVPHP